MIASLLLQTNSDIFLCVAGGLIIYTVYTLDRALESQEDAINRTELNGSNKKVGLTVSLLAVIIGSYILAKEGILTLAFLPFITGYLYSKGIKASYKYIMSFPIRSKWVNVGFLWIFDSVFVIQRYPRPKRTHEGCVSVFHYPLITYLRRHFKSLHL